MEQYITQDRIMGAVSYSGADSGSTGSAVFATGGFSLAGFVSPNPAPGSFISNDTATHVVSQTNDFMSGETGSDNLYGHCVSCHNVTDPYADSGNDDGWGSSDEGSAGTSWGGDSDDPGSC